MTQQDNEMTDEEFIGYCEIHCATQRALFLGRDINRMYALAGRTDTRVPEGEWFTVRSQMMALCDSARKRLAK